MSSILLKARPTERQLADRLAAPVPDGIELYLDRIDLIGGDWLERTANRIQSIGLPKEFIWIVEAPIRTLGDQYLDLTCDDADHRETLRRVLAVGKAIGAVGANIHVVRPSLDPARLTEVNREAALVATGPLLGYYVATCEEFGMVPQVENIPPVGRMREGAYVFSAIGAAPDDLIALSKRFPTLRFTADVSHAALYLNWRATRRERLAQRFWPVVDYYSSSDHPRNLAEYLDAISDRVTAIHVANADGCFGEGLGYCDGPEDLDRALTPWLATSCWLVTETLERDADNARGMRDAQARLSAILGSTPVRSH